MQTIHSPKAFTRGRNNPIRPHSTYLNRLNAKLLEEALIERDEWDKIIDANKLKDSRGQRMANPVTGHLRIHPTKGYRFDRF
ncbi:hypothetical protein HNR26_002335 [Rhizobium rosettiformans]|uniref:Uncharacterized protein n=2 Tax=Rhizobium rosettiformans TaxID=1368430 RepID=A0A4S8Q327_9HYPH|nr:hypothetical protein [Rhizobium rosettiformans]MBB5276283.1 hypothetical protein [Rhizobium rosettiformans]THV36915.1 hypothetical protein FAA86_10495 [Rhizobium rosettiformans W3]